MLDRIPTPVDLYFQEIRPAIENILLDEITGFWSRDRHAVAAQALLYGEAQGVEVFYVCVDIRNVGGANAVLNWSGVAEQIFKPFANFLRRALEESLAGLAQCMLFRQGGDEFSAVVAGIRGSAFMREDLERALKGFESEVRAYATRMDFDGIPNPKGTIDPGVGVFYALAPLSTGSPVDRAFALVDGQIEQLKKARRTHAG
jgi:GGDEF domain-containing protein